MQKAVRENIWVDIPEAYKGDKFKVHKNYPGHARWPEKLLRSVHRSFALCPLRKTSTALGMCTAKADQNPIPNVYEIDWRYMNEVLMESWKNG